MASLEFLCCLKKDILCAFPQHFFADGAQVFFAFDDGEEMVAGKLPHFAGKAGGSVGEQDFGFAVAAGVEEDFAGGGVAGVVFKADVELEVAEGNPACFAAPAGVDEFLAVGEQLAEFGAGFGGVGLFEAGDKLGVGNGYA